MSFQVRTPNIFRNYIHQKIRLFTIEVKNPSIYSNNWVATGRAHELNFSPISARFDTELTGSSRPFDSLPSCLDLKRIN